jgi:hypothetical protein
MRGSYKNFQNHEQSSTGEETTGLFCVLDRVTTLATPVASTGAGLTHFHHYHNFDSGTEEHWFVSEPRSFHLQLVLWYCLQLLLIQSFLFPVSR